MRIVALVPVKNLARAKSRLTPPYTLDERAAFVRDTLAHVLSAITASGVVARTLVVSPDATVWEQAVALGATSVPDTAGKLNRALDLARAVALGDGADAVLVVHADLPRLLPTEIAAMVAMLPVSPAAVLAPDHTGTGTNALLLAPPDALPFRFGTGSFARHRAEAAARALPYVTYHAVGIAGDVDTPDDMVVAVSGQHPAVGE